MSDNNLEVPPPDSCSRPVGGTEYSWCKSVPTGTGITVLALLLNKAPDSSFLRSAIQSLQESHPILRSKLRFHAAANSFSFFTPSSPHLEIATFDLLSVSQILDGACDSGAAGLTRFHLILEHELNRNAWCDPHHSEYADGLDVFHASLYALSEERWALVLRLHTAACDRAAAAALLRKLLGFVGGGAARKEIVGEDGLNPAIEDLVPKGKADKPFWARGVNLLGYSLNSLRLANLNFEDAGTARASQVMRLQMNSADTDRLLAGCKSRGIKLCGALAAAALLAAHSSKDLPGNKWEKYGVVTLIDCRSLLDPPISRNSPGFYHSAILNSHDVCGQETLWELATRTYASFSSAKDNSKHFSDMGDLNFLMCRAIENPGLTPSGSMRTAFVSVFEDSIVDESNSELIQEIGLVDYIGCSSVHGVGPSVALFDTIRDGGLDCACLYPSPLHSRTQMQRVIDHMRRILTDCAENVEINGQ